MEISKSLQEEIIAVQNKLQNAILEHQIHVGRLKDDPNNTDILGQIQKIQVHIVSLGRCQKQIVQRLRKEVEAFKADNANGSKVSIPSFLGLNNNNHITNNNETKREAAANGFETKPSKEDYEEVVRNGDVHHSSPRDNDCAKIRPSSVETISGEDDIVEVSMDENSCEKQEAQEERNAESPEKQNFLYALGLITKSKCMELQNRRVERKRRSTANPQFVYSMLEQPSKRKRHSYLQSGNAPHTRQTTARLNGPSPPPSKAQPTKSISPPVQTITKSLIPVQKSTTRPNILRNADSKVFVNKSKIEDNQMRSSVSSAKSIQSIGNKAVHIPGLPSSLTIERIGNDSVVCICCRNPGSLTICKNCSSNYHVSCHSRSPAPFRTCPKCVLAMDEEDDMEKDEEAEVKGQAEGERKLARYRKDEKLAATSYASGVIGKAREDSEIYKTAGGLHKIDTTQKKCILSNAFGINQLPASTFLIPITTNNNSASNQPESSKSFTSIVDVEQRADGVPRNSHVVFNQHSRSGIAYVHQTADQMPYTYQLPGTTVQPEKHQSYLIVKKITESSGRPDQSTGGEVEDQNRSAVFNYQLSAGNSTVESDRHSLVTHSLLFNSGNNRKKQSNRSVPALHRVTNVSKLSNSPHAFSSDYQLDRATLNGRKPWAKLTRGKLCINQPAKRATETLLSFCGDSENGNEQLQQRPKSAGSAEEAATATANLSNRGKHRSRAGTLIHSLFPGHNKPHIVAGGARESRSFSPNDRDYPLLRQQLCRAEHELEQQPREQPDKPATVQLQRRALTRFFEHVKLEEAHIPAPLRTKLAHKDDKIGDDEEDAREEGAARDQQYDDGDAVAEAPLLTSCDLDGNRLLVSFPWVAHNARDSRDDDDDTSNNQSPVHHPADIAPDDFESYELARDAQSPCMMAYRQLAENPDRPDGLSSDAYCARRQGDDGATIATLRISQSNLPELRNQVSVPDDKAETERQDLPSGRRSRSNSSSSDSSNSSSSNSTTNSSSSGPSDTPEQAMNNVNHFSNDFGIFSAKESEDELRRHELAMSCEADCSDAATG
ncbi:uncharacterized protein LOC105280524 [Ooceraea biroi]|uniref:uncharacterized protein LOC105280524 n=1 Tax=Ooceraea biroi TaxID=2015173 RepID=UPI000F08F9AF|nr:uncharacterized protein LOC105280524 [Ooceraea biroi]